MKKLLKMLSNKQHREHLIEFQLVIFSYSKEVRDVLNNYCKQSTESDFFSLVSKLELDTQSAAVFTFNNVEIRLNIFPLSEPESSNRENAQFFSFKLLSEYLEYLVSEEEMEGWLAEGVTIEDIE